VDYRVPKGDATGRWNTVYDMLTSFLHLRQPLHLLCFDDPRLMTSWPTPHEWDIVDRFSDILKEYKEATLVMESETEVSITWAFPMMDRLMGTVERLERRGNWSDEAVQQSLQLSWESLRKYYRHMNQSVYYVCLFLDPQVKMSYVEHNWERDWLGAVEDSLQRAWARYKHIQLPAPSESRPSQHHTGRNRPVPLNPFCDEIEQQAQAEIPADELEQYRQMPPMSAEIWASRFESNVLLWWRESGQYLFPRLALMAKDFYPAQGILSLPLLSAPVLF
jgi:hypothetical protein